MNNKFKFLSSLFSLTLLLMVIITSQSCYKRDYTIPADTNVFDNSKMVTASLYGIITDEAGAPVENAVAKTGGYTALTDANGLFFFNNITTPSHATTVVVTKAGYFNGSRTLAVKASQKHTVRISLMDKGTAQVFNSANGANVDFPNGVSVTFPANGIVNKATGAPYTGQVYMYAKKIDPTTELGRNTMPGDLRGVDNNGVEKYLETYGMMVAELYDINGVPLQINATNPATLSLTVPTSLQGAAPQNIILWSYNEATGMWKEDGSATLNGNKYVGNIKHFSFWNCDQPCDAIFIEMTLVDQNANPLSGYTVKLINNANLDARYGWTNASGWVGGMCYSNTSLTMEVYQNNGVCGNNVLIYTNPITVGAVNLNLGNIVVNPLILATCSFNATVHDCNGFPLANSAVYIPQLQLILTPNALGQISYTLPCVPVAPITLKAYDLTNNVYGTSNYTLVAGVNNIGVISACGNVTPFLNITLTNTVTLASANKTFLAPADILNCYLQGPTTMISAQDPLGGYVFMIVDGITVGTFNVNSFNVNGVGVFTDLIFTIAGVNTTTFTSFPAFPNDVQGTFSLNLIGSPSGDTYTAVGDFRIPRQN